MGHNWIGILKSKDETKPPVSGGCSLCHPGFGKKPNTVDKLNEEDYNNIDCLICHAEGYKRVVVKEGDNFKIVPDPNIDIIMLAKSVKKPTNEMCLRCHLGTGGGPNHKHGVTPTKDSDVHMQKGLHCVDCHITKNHKIAGGSDVKAQELIEIKVDCTNCHKKVHAGKYEKILNKHTKNIACQTCHIPLIARDPRFPTVVLRDWTKPVYNEKTGLYGPTNVLENNLKPEYHWWNRFMKNPPEPVGSRKDKKSKITPWKRANYINIGDAETGKVVYIKAGVYAVTGNIDQAAKKGAEDAKQAYSGKWKGVSETMVFSLNHQIAPAKDALKCDACHSENSVLDFKKLGYSDKEINKLKKVKY